MLLTRYVSFPRFVSSLKDGLFIPSPKLFDDRWEGLIPFAHLTSNEHEIAKEEYQEFAQWLYVSCWHLQEHESFPMWKIYGQSQESVLFRTTSDKLQGAFTKQYPNALAYFDKVDYVDPSVGSTLLLDTEVNHISRKSPADVKGGEWFPYMLMLYKKHHTYEYEKEFRLVTLDTEYLKTQPNQRIGIYLDVRSVDDFFEDIVISPGAPSWFFEAVSETVKLFGFKCEVKRSELDMLK